MKRTDLDEWKLLMEQLYKQFSPDMLDSWAKESGWIKRKRKLDAYSFLHILLYHCGNLAGSSLRELSLSLEETCHISMTPEAINQRLNKELIVFLKKCLEHFIQMKLNYQLPISDELQKFCERIRIIDATIHSLPSDLKETFPGVYRAELKCQLEYEFLTGQFLLADWRNGKENDSLYGKYQLETVSPGDLFLQDLGYFHLPTFKKIDETGGYFVSRVRPDCSIYTGNPNPRYHADGRVVKSSFYQKESLAEHLEQMERGSIREWEEVYVGYDYKFPTRLILYRHTEEQDKSGQYKRKHSRYQTKEHVRALDGATIIMTNLPDIIPAEKVMDLYRLRWQIELLFKGWKSNFPTTFYKQIKEERVLCHFFAHLLLFLITATTTYQARLFLLEKSRIEISIQKGISVALRFIRLMFESIKKYTKLTNGVLKRFHDALCKHALKTKGPPEKDPLIILGANYS